LENVAAKNQGLPATIRDDAARNVDRQAKKSYVKHYEERRQVLHNQPNIIRYHYDDSGDCAVKDCGKRRYYLIFSQYSLLILLQSSK
jgi:hypothetical protein